MTAICWVYEMYVTVNECAVMEHITVGSGLSAGDIPWQVEELNSQIMAGVKSTFCNDTVFTENAH